MSERSSTHSKTLLISTLGSHAHAHHEVPPSAPPQPLMRVSRATTPQVWVSCWASVRSSRITVLGESQRVSLAKTADFLIEAGVAIEHKGEEVAAAFGKHLRDFSKEDLAQYFILFSFHIKQLALLTP